MGSTSAAAALVAMVMKFDEWQQVTTSRSWTRSMASTMAIGGWWRCFGTAAIVLQKIGKVMFWVTSFRPAEDPSAEIPKADSWVGGEGRWPWESDWVAEAWIWTRDRLPGEGQEEPDGNHWKSKRCWRPTPWSSRTNGSCNAHHQQHWDGDQPVSPGEKQLANAAGDGGNIAIWNYHD